jgi:hypothetical protein
MSDQGMDMEESQLPFEEGGAPPEETGSLETASRWPGAVGTISIILGSLGLACWGCMSIGTIAGPWLQQMAPQEQRTPLPGGFQLFVQVFQQCGSAGLSFWLLFAGIGLVRRRPWSRMHHIAWSVAKILLILVTFVASFAFYPQALQQINDQFSKMKVQFTVTTAMLAVAGVVQMLFFLIWPVFLLIWFSRGAVKEEVAAWAEEDRAMI